MAIKFGFHTCKRCKSKKRVVDSRFGFCIDCRKELGVDGYKNQGDKEINRRE